MSESSINVTEGSGKRLHAWDRTIGATLVQDQFMLPGEYPLASYETHAIGASTAVANDHSLQVMAGASNYVRIRRIRVEQLASATTAAICNFQILRLTTAGTGGSVMTPRPWDSGDTAATATSMQVPTAKGTEGVELLRFAIAMRQAVSGTASPADDPVWEWAQLPGQKPLIIPAGTANGICVKNTTAVAAATVMVSVEFVETAWLGA
jgi:hypothetical protein